MGTDRERRWAAVYAHRERLLRLSRARCANVQDAEDCVQEAMLRCVEFENLDEARLGQFLTTVTIRLCTDLHRGRTRGDRLSRRLAAFSAVEPGPEDAVCDRAESAWLSRHVESLPARQREIVHARAAGQSCGAVAEQLRMSYAAIESALSRARRTLRVTLESSLGLATLSCSKWRSRYLEAGALGLSAAAITVAGLGGHTPADPAARHPVARPASTVPVGVDPHDAAVSANRSTVGFDRTPGTTAPAGHRSVVASPPGGADPEDPSDEWAHDGNVPGVGGAGVRQDEPGEGAHDPTLYDCVWYGVQITPRLGCKHPSDDRDDEQVGTQGIPRGVTP